MWLSIVGIIILVVGFMIGSGANFVEWEDQADMMAVGQIVAEVGGLLLLIGLIVPAFSVHGLDSMVRAGLLIGSAILMGLFTLALATV